MYRTQNNQKGFAILFAVVGAALVLSIGLTISLITTKEVQISATSRESQLAAYAADSGAECAELYKNAFATSTDSGGTLPAFNCGSGPLPSPFEPKISSQNSRSATTEFYIEFGETGKRYCSYIRMEVIDTLNTGYSDDYNIYARGYNVSCAQIDSYPRVLERGFEIDA